MQVLANPLNVPVHLRVAGGASVTLQPQHRLLVAAPVLGMGACTVAPLPVAGMARVLAYCDHAHGVARSGPALPVQVVAAAVVEQPEVARRWMIAQLAHDAAPAAGTPLHALLRALAHTECYGLVRFLLAHGPHDTVAGLAARYGLSLAHFNRRCRTALGGPLKRELRVLRAARALLEYPGRAHTFTHLAADHGYASASHFCTDIKQLVGRSPQSLYRAIAPLSE